MSSGFTRKMPENVYPVGPMQKTGDLEFIDGVLHERWSNGSQLQHFTFSDGAVYVSYISLDEWRPVPSVSTKPAERSTDGT